MKKLLTVVLAALMVLSLAGCGGETTNTPAEKTKVTIWGTWTDAQQELLQKFAADFTASQDKYEVVYEGQVYNGFDDTLYQAVMAGQGPDIIIDYASKAATYQAEGKVAELSKYVSADTLAQLSDGARKEASSFVDGGTYVYPIILSGPITWINPDILATAGVEVPTTWDELWAACETISEKVTVVTDSEGKKTYVTDGTGEHIYGFASDSHTDFAQTLAMQSGVGVYDVKNQKCLFNDEKVATILQNYADGVADGSILKAPTGDYLSNDFNAGIVAMYFGSVAGEPYLSETHAAAKVPATANGTPWTPAWNRGVMIFDYEDEARKQGAAAFLEYFVSAEHNLEWCKNCNYQSCLKWTLALDDYKAFLADNASLACLEPEIAGCFDAVTDIAYVRTGLKKVIDEIGAGTSVKDALQVGDDYVMGEVK